jgi:hypothetical protein
VRHGEVGFAWLNGQVVELEPGIEVPHNSSAVAPNPPQQVVDDPNFKFETTVKRSQDVIRKTLLRFACFDFSRF